MNYLKLNILFFLFFTIQSSYSQDVPLSQRLIEDGYGYLKGWYYQGTPDDAKKSFTKAKRLFFYRKSIVNNANLGLSEYYLKVYDTINSIKTLKNIIGHSNSKKIENSQFSKLKKTKKDDLNAYSATKKRIQIALNQKDISTAEKYLIYLKDYVIVSWYCGTGLIGHSDFIEEVEMKIKEQK